MMGFGPAIGGIFFIFLWLLWFGGFIVGYIIMLIAIWRAMKAHENISQTLLRIALNYEKKTT
ncbi:MAG: hypothetical protein AMS15_05680 [Planctomycetes bacterium DG_23]|nr:MAG: hypothetical protein AMS15_05680 [Planctomycetes bacterium DG_23]